MYNNPGDLAGVENLMVYGRLYANQSRYDFSEISGTYKLLVLPKNSILEQAVVKNAEAFDGTLKLGNKDHDEAYLADVDFPKTVGMHDPIMVGAPVAEMTVVQLKVSGCTTGLGTIWLLWKPLI